MTTTLLYLEDFYVLDCTATVRRVGKTEDGRDDIVLDQTCLYPRGGGQDWDTGTITADRGSFKVEEVRLDENGVVHHIGHGQMAEGDSVRCVVDKNRRQMNTRLHSGGHVIDMAMSKLGSDLVPAKGAHYPQMSFVEYEGTLDDPEVLTEKLNKKINEILEENTVNELRFVSKDELDKLCRHVPSYIPDNKPTRVVLYGDFGVPCGGTHVRKLSEVGKLEVTRIKSKKGLTKISYRIEGIN